MNLAIADIAALPIADNSIDLIFTDPPYPKEYLPCYDWLAKEAIRILKPGSFILAMCGGSFINQIFRMFDDSGLHFFWKCEIEKASYNPGVTWLHGKPVCNFIKSIIIYFKGEPNMELVRGNFYDLFNSRTVPDKTYHHWGQNVNNANYYINHFSLPDNVVLDPFVGGSTTMIACKLIGRHCIGFDIDPSAINATRSRLLNTDIPKQGAMF
jgi:DNA modification methylase